MGKIIYIPRDLTIKIIPRRAAVERKRDRQTERESIEMIT